MRAPGTKRGQRVAPATLSARLVGHVSLEAQASGEIVACFDGFSVGLGTFGAAAAERALGLRTGLPLSSFGPDGRDGDKEIDQIVRRLAARGLLEYRLGGSRKGEDKVNREALLAVLTDFLKANNLKVDWAGVESAPNEALVNALAMMSPYGSAEKQAMLEAPDLKTRAEILIAVTEMDLAKKRTSGDPPLQ